MIKLEELLNQIPSDDRRVLQVLSIYWEQISQKDMHTLLSILDLKHVDGSKYNHKQVAEFRHGYVEKGILNNTKEFWGNGFQIASTSLKEMFTREARAEPWFSSTVFAIQSHFPNENRALYLQVGAKYESILMRDYRLSIYAGNRGETETRFVEIQKRGLTAEAADLVYEIFSNPFQGEFLAEFDHLFQINTVVWCYRKYIQSLKSTDELWAFSKEHGLDKAPIIKGIKAEELILKGELDDAEVLIGDSQDLMQITSAATISFLRKDYAAAAAIYVESIKRWRKLEGKRKGFTDDWQMFLYGLSLYKTDETKFHKFAEEYISYSQKNFPDRAVERALESITYYLKNNPKLAGFSFQHITTGTFFEQLLRTLTAAIIPTIDYPESAPGFEKAVGELGLEWVEMEASNLRSLKAKGGKKSITKTADLQNKLGIDPVGNIFPKLENWERALKSLLIVAKNVPGASASGTKQNETRLAWLIDIKRHTIQPVEQKFTRNSWTKGRNIALKRLFESEYKKANEHDVAVVRRSLRKRHNAYGYGASYIYEFDWETALPALVGHPLLFSQENPDMPLELAESEPSLIIKESDGALELSFDSEILREGISLQKETELRYKILKVSKHHVEIANSLRNNRLKVPIEGRDLLLKAILPLSNKISIQSDLEEHFEELPLVEPETRIHALLTQSGEGFHLEFFVKPFGSVPPYFKPGKGGESVIAEIDGIRTRTKRDLKSEVALLDEIEEECPFLAKFESQNYEWFLGSVEECLTAMTEIETPRIEGKLIVEWTKGQKLKLLGNITTGNFSLSVKSKNEWFVVDGKATINKDLVLSIQELRGLLHNNTNNFIELSDGEFVAITDTLRRHLQSIDAILDDKNRLHGLRSGILDEISSELEHFKADKAWKTHLERIAESGKFVPKLPATFEAELRPYQIDGYNWLSRLAHMGVGACLADDMGLGKTLQALAVLVERADTGPALVVAPVSVCRNWIKEAMRFAPTLKFQIFGGGDRAEVVGKLDKYDVLVTSYSLLHTEQELFINKEFATVVLDEAQAVKNPNTKRSRAVMKLKAGFRMVTTGTPIENHLGELWNLFNFLNPGLLGSPAFFNEKFATPIERDKDEQARKTLQRLVQPFILRRRKNQVLDDLPAKTEITLAVEMSEAEAAFYESLRREAINTIESTEGAVKGKRFRILAELTRLRLACCHPKLVDENIPIEGSKLELFAETLDELIDNKHKALVFSQFVKHLRIVEEYLKEKGISYQYLDGSTPSNKRQQRIDDFQRGKGDVFLISLKAGGTGLNLTAADYVIHLDPWWNPAVEDQATDRVHRIGQRRPVTVYRLVTENTVEEKILKLHETKRDLADSLLDGTDTSGKLSSEDLLALIKEG